MQSKGFSLLIIDDEPGAVQALLGLIRHIPEVGLVETALLSSEALAKNKQFRPDLVLVDVQLSDGNGFDLVADIRKENPDCGVVFVTAYDHYALQALKISALDYLLKPVALTELQLVVRRFMQKNPGAELRSKLEQLQQFLHDGKRVKFNHRDGFFLIDPQEIMACEASGSYSELKLVSGRSEVVSLNLGQLEEMLEAYGFFRISRSDLINLAYLSRVNRRLKQCVLQAGTIELSLRIPTDRIGKLEDRLLM